MWLDITLASKDDFSKLGDFLFDRYQKGYHNEEEIAAYITNEIYNRVLDSSHENLFALIRIFRFGHFNSLALDLQSQINNTSETPYWMALMGTYGDNAQWRHRQFSENHRVFPANTDSTPMLKEIFGQMMFNPGDQLTRNDARMLLNSYYEGEYERSFHIENVTNSPHIPAQEEFVRVYGICSVVGFGGIFIGDAGFMCIGFTKIPLDRVKFQKFIAVAPAVARLLTLYDGRQKIWMDS